MPFQNMQAELRGAVPKVPFSFCATLVNRAWKEVRERNLWSFNLFESAWITPPLVNAGTVVTVQGLTTVTFDATALAALNAASTTYSLITQRQFRIGVGGIYNIIAFNSGTGVATLDRMYADPTVTGSVYQVYQLYYTPPMADFLTWMSVRNPQMFIDLDLDTTRAQIDAIDPQRSWYQFPSRVIPWGTDTRAGSGTAGYALFELWGQPIQLFTYQCYGLRRGVDLVAPTDALPIEVGEDTVMARAREMAYEWAEANKDIAPRSVGPDFKFLMGKARADFDKYLGRDRRNDKEKVNNFFSVRGSGIANRAVSYYNTLAGVAGPYGGQ